MSALPESLPRLAPTPHRSRLVRTLLIIAGGLCVLLGAIGIVIPVLPTTPFLILATACFARASPAFHQRLLRSKTFGPLILEWEQHRSIPWRAKLLAIGMMSLSIAGAIVFVVRPWQGKVALAVVGVAVGVWLWRIPSRDRPRHTGGAA